MVVCVWCDVSLVFHVQKKIVDFLSFGWFFEFFSGTEAKRQRSYSDTMGK